MGLVPPWMRLSILSGVAILFAAAIAMLAFSMFVEGQQVWATPATALAETAGTGLLVLLVLYFVDRSRGSAALGDLTRRFFVSELPRAFSKMEHDEPPLVPWMDGSQTELPDLASHVTIEMSYARGAYNAQYVLTVAGSKLRIAVQFNIRRLNVTYVMQGHAGETAEDAFAALRDTFTGAGKAGYEIGVASEITGRSRGRGAAQGWDRSFAHSLHRDLDPDFVSDDAQRQFVAQDLAIMTRSLMAERGLLPYGT